jgi:threonine synthase
MSLRYRSTRGDAARVGFLDAVLGGLAPDGGLWVPEQVPHLRAYLREGRGSHGYIGAAAEALYLFAEGDLSFAGAADHAGRAYGESFAHPAVAPLKQIGAKSWLMELFHGPSLAFKDIAMQLIGALYDTALTERDARLTVICATSGDTGGAAVEALKGLDRVDLFVLLPKGRVSDVQRRFMTGSGAANVHALEVDGDFDACQALVKALFADGEFSTRARLSAVNSINWARIAAQSVYFTRAALALGGEGSVDFVVPSGNFGDALAGSIAKRMGAPVGRILAATNSNDILARALETGRYARAAASLPTISPAMDIQVSSNFERLVFEALDHDGAATAGLYAQFAQSGSFDLPPRALASMRETFSGAAVSDDATRAAMRMAHQETGEVLCPHTAVGYAALKSAPAPFANPVVLLATAHPAKFPETVEDVLGVKPALPAHAADLLDRAERIDPITDDTARLKALIKERSRAWS